MAIEITRREVLNNLIRFKDNLLELREREKGKEKGEERSYQVLLNRRTGDMRFAQKISSLEHHFPRKSKESAEDWKEVRIIVSEQKSNRAPVHFEVRDAENHELKPNDVDPLAWRIAHETLEVLNIKAKEVGKVLLETLPEEEILRDLSSIHLAPQGSRIEDLPGWTASLNRFEAEKKLKGKEIGTYLLREGDPLSFSLSFHHSLSNLISATPFVLTLVETEGRLSEFLLLRTEKGWLVYNDEPDLSRYPLYPTPREAIHSLSGLARRALV